MKRLKAAGLGLVLLLIGCYCILAATMPSVPVYWWDDVSRWIKAEDAEDTLRTRAITDSLKVLRAADTLRRHNADDSLRALIGACPDTLDTVVAALWAAEADHADSADNAASAWFADSAGEAAHAYEADHADSADNAASAWFADSAGDAAHAYEADSADHAESADHADTAGYAYIADTSLHCADLSGIMFFTVTVIDTNWTVEGDTATADTSDMVCYDGVLWDWLSDGGSFLRTNSGWDTLTTYDGIADKFSTCVSSPSSFERASSACAGSVAINASSLPNDTLFVYGATSPGSDCTPKDSLAVYSDGSKWHPVCTYIYSWHASVTDCYTRYDTCYAVIAGDTMMVAAWTTGY